MKSAPTSRKGKAAPAGLRGVALIARAVAPSPESKATVETRKAKVFRELMAAVGVSKPLLLDEAKMRARFAELGIDEALAGRVRDILEYDRRATNKNPLEAPATKSKALVEKSRKPSYKPDMDGLNNYLKSQGVPEPLQPQLAAKIDRLVKAEISGRKDTPPALSFAAALEAMTLKEDRHAALLRHYGKPDEKGNYALPETSKWENVRGAKATPEQFSAWLDAVFPDRREIGLLVSDLEKLDLPARTKIYNWSVPDAAARRDMIELFGLRLGVTKYDPVRDADAPTSFKEVLERSAQGEASFDELNRLYGRTKYHAGTPT